MVTTQADASPARTSSPPRRLAGMGVVIVGLLWAMLPGSTLWMVLAGASIALSVGLPLLVADAPGAARRLVPVAAISLALIAGLATYARASGDGTLRDRAHDGGVIVTRAAADDIGSFANPYAHDFTEVLPASWQDVQGVDGEIVPNPVADHFPYLPAAAIVHTPFVLGADAAGWVWDPRILGWGAMVAALVALARRPEADWLKLGAICGLAGPFSIVYLSWGTNDLLAVSLAVLALCLADRRPGWAGVVLAVALSTKLLLAVLVPPLVVVLAVAGGWEALKRWWTLPATLVVTCLPFFIADPQAFLDDTVWFNLGRTEPLMPTSGLGLPAVAPGFDGVLLAAVTALGILVAFVAPMWAARRWPSVWTAGAAAGLALLPLLIPARTFQINYLVLVAALVPLAWLALARFGRPPLIDAEAH